MAQNKNIKQLKRKMRHFSSTVDENAYALRRSFKHFLRHIPPIAARISAAAFVLLALGAAYFFFFSRQEEEAQPQAAIEETPVQDFFDEFSDVLPVDAPFMTGDYHIAVVLGYGYNDADFADRLKALLRTKFGLADMGLIMPFVFPDDFTRGSVARISDLYEKIADGRLKALIIAGSPEQTNRVLAKINDDRSTELGYTIVSISSQDDTVGTEAVSDIVLDFAVAGLTGAVSGTSALPEEVEVTGADSLPEILFTMIPYLYMLPAPLPSDSEMPVHLGKMLGGSWSIKPFIDSETGMRSVNHFVIDRTDVQDKNGRDGKKK